jgi:hypothetical protein
MHLVNTILVFRYKAGGDSFLLAVLRHRRAVGLRLKAAGAGLAAFALVGFGLGAARFLLGCGRLFAGHWRFPLGL